jgi:DnaJ-domain-containing protein 1
MVYNQGPMAPDQDRVKRMEFRKKLRDRTGELHRRVEKSSCEALEKVFYERMDTYFIQEGRLDEMEKLLVHLIDEIDQTEDAAGLKRLGDRLNYLEIHFEEIDSALFDRPIRLRRRPFDFFKFFRQARGAADDDLRGEFLNTEEAYRELGLEPGSDFRTVKTAFRRLVKQLHPDSNNGDRATEPKLRRLVAAYEYIKRRS